jgi:predicted heme/steroid binding protein
MAKNEIATKKEYAVSTAVSFEDDAAQGGFENMGQEDRALPFLRLLTNTSPEVGEVDGAMPGMIYNTVTGQLYDYSHPLCVCQAIHRVGTTRRRVGRANRYLSRNERYP